MKTTFLTIFLALIACKGDANDYAVSVKKINKPIKIINHITTKQINGITEIENSDFISSTLRDKVRYETFTKLHAFKILYHRSIVNIHDNTKTDQEMQISLAADNKTILTYYLANPNSILMKGIIYSSNVELANGVKVGINISKIEQLFGCIIQKTANNKFRIFDADGLIEIILHFNSAGIITFIQINTSHYIS